MINVKIDDERTLAIGRLGTREQPGEIELRLILRKRGSSVSSAVSIEFPADAKTVAVICGAILGQL